MTPRIHPGRVLPEVFMEPLGLSQNKLAEALDEAQGRQIVQNKYGVPGIPGWYADQSNYC
jgi:plasmid maintenance system antidote protein VapI